MEGKDFKIIFMGTPEFAVATLKQLVTNKYKVVAVVTSADKPAGRGKKIHESDIKKYAQSVDIPILQPTSLKSPEFIKTLQSYHADLQIVVAFRMLPEQVWAMPKYGTINLHASLLPNYRGAAPINWAIINGDKETGVSSFFIEKEIDTGNIIYQEKIPIEPSDNAGSLHDKLMHLGATVIQKTIDDVAENKNPKIDQNLLLEQKVNAAPKIFKDDCKINWDWNSEKIHHFVRGLSPYPAAWTELKNSDSDKIISLKIFDATYEIQSHNRPIGSIISDGKKTFQIATKDGYLSLNNIQLSGKKRMDTNALLRGFDIKQNWAITILR